MIGFERIWFFILFIYLAFFLFIFFYFLQVENKELTCSI
jgi:hypothetical protein